jgi:hypothetical protein
MAGSSSSSSFPPSFVDVIVLDGGKGMPPPLPTPKNSIFKCNICIESYVCGKLPSIIEMITKTPVTNFTFFTGLLVYRCHRVVVTIEFPRQILRQLYLF